MTRIRSAFISGTILNNPLAIGDTSLSSAGLASLPAVASPDVAAIILDPAGSAGVPEVVWVTAHTGSATTATISRGKEGTTARQHALSVAWVHGPTIFDMTQRKGSDIASASTITLPDTDEDYFHITGTTTITAISERASGKRVTFEFTGACPITHNGTSLILYNATSITTVAGDVLEFISESSGNWRQISRTPPAATLTNATAVGTNVTLTTSGTHYDCPSGSVSLAAGTWLLVAKISFSFAAAPNIGDSVAGEIRDGSNNVIQQSFQTVISNPHYWTVPLATIVTPGTTTTYKLSGINITTNGGTCDGGRINAIKLA